MTSSDLQDNRSWRLAAAAIFALATAWLLYCAHGLPSWHDETVSLLELAGNPMPSWPDGVAPAQESKARFQGSASFSEIVPMLYRTDVHPPLYYFAALAWSKLFGGELFSLRLLSVLSILATGLIVSRCAARYGGFARLTALILFFGAPVTIWAGVNARDYALAGLLVSAGLLCASRELAREGAETPDGAGAFWPILLTGVFGGLAFLTHYFTLLVMAPVFAFLALYRIKSRPGAVIAGGATFALCLAVVSPMLLQHLGARPGQFAGFEAPLKELVALLVMLFTAMLEPSGDLWAGGLQFVIFSVVLVLATVQALRTAKRDPVGALHLAALYGFCLGLFLLFLVTDKSLIKSNGLSRYAVFLAPLLALVFARVIGRAFAIRRAAGIALLAVFTLFVGVTWYDGELRRAQWVNSALFSHVNSALAQQPRARSLVVVPLGFGRGTPGTWAQELPEDVRLAIVKEPGDIAALQALLPDLEIVVIGDSLAKTLSAELEDFKTLLQARGFHSEASYLYLRQPGGGN